MGKLKKNVVESMAGQCVVARSGGRLKVESSRFGSQSGRGKCNCWSDILSNQEQKRKNDYL